MSQCYICKKPISSKRKLYCSDKCNKRRYYLAHHRGPTVLRSRDIVAWYATESGKGYKWEEYAATILQAKLNNTIEGGFGKHCDLTWGEYQVEVKSANLYKRKYKRGREVDPTQQVGWWRFDRGAGQGSADYFLCIGLVNNVPVKHFLIPNAEFGKRGVTISPTRSRYDQFLYSPH